MENIAKLLEDIKFVKVLMDSLPCGLFVINAKGQVVAVNDAMKRVFGVDYKKRDTLDFGIVFGCLHSYESNAGCGFSEGCYYCEARHLAFEALKKNKKCRARTTIEFIIDGQVKNGKLLLSAVPCDFNGERLCVLIIEDIGMLQYLVLTDSKEGFRGIIGQNKRIKNVLQTIKEVGQSKVPVLIHGESGTGKELVALAIHRESQRSNKPFVPVNCGGLAEGLIESELFGHVKGSFTGAAYSKKGRFGIADEGTIFLDEVSELSPKMQVKLLRVLQNGQFEPVGSEKTVNVNVRVISATNRDLRKLVLAKKFRKDLYYRLCVVPIELPPLREREQDLSILIDFFLKKYCNEGLRPIVSIAPEALSVLKNHSWPGNVRELQNVLQAALTKCHEDIILPNHLPALITWDKPKIQKRTFKTSKLDTVTVIKAIQKAKGNKSKAAKILGVSRSTLYRFLDHPDGSARN